MRNFQSAFNILNDISQNTVTVIFELAMVGKKEIKVSTGGKIFYQP